MNKLFLTSLSRWLGLAVLLTTLFATPGGHVLAQDTGTKVFIDPPEKEVGVGDTTKVDIRIENVTGLAEAVIHLEFAPALLEVVDTNAGEAGVQIQPGGFLKSTTDNLVDQARGRIYFGASRGDGDPVGGNGVLATVTFRAKAVGTSKIKFENAILKDGDGGQISAATEKGKIIVGGTPTPTSTPTGTPAPRTHIVRQGEWLYCIARAYGVDPKAIAEKSLIVNPNLIHPDQGLKIPDGPAWWLPGMVCQAQFDGGTPPPACRLHHTVVMGETLFSISVKYEVSVWAIAEANRIYNLNCVRAGHVLCIP